MMDVKALLLLVSLVLRTNAVKIMSWTASPFVFFSVQMCSFSESFKHGVYKGMSNNTTCFVVLQKCALLLQVCCILTSSSIL